jgi:peptidoglycan biosynthesis protein MviN/MurJ (putative lipid II flippase)
LTVGFLSLLGILTLSLFGKLIIEILFGYGNVNPDNIIECWNIMICLSGVFIGGALGQIASSKFYASGDTATPVIISIITYTVYIPLKILLFNLYGVYGLAVLMSVYYIIDFLLLHFFVGRRKKQLNKF